ncbi:MAG: hypothetical protein JWM11_6675 [Planctomycetaceae bacterium]|nr:hypothetical protein [Planctomycetaceae bacterium]
MPGISRPEVRTWASVIHALLHYDFCPAANYWVYWLKRPEATLLAAGMVALACALFVQPIAFVGFAAILVTLALGWFWPWIAVRGLRSELKFLQVRTTEGQAARVQLRIHNRCPWPIWGLSLEGGLIPHTNSEQTHFKGETAMALARVSGWSTIEFDWEFTPQSRGVYPFSVPKITTGFPFGLMRAGRMVHTTSQLLAWPQTATLDVLLDSVENNSSQDILCEHRVGDCGDLLGTRTFRQGDPLRRVHWAQTARHGRLIVLERQAAAQACVRIVVDLESAMHVGRGASSTLEWTIRLAASVAEIYHQQHAAVECYLGPKLIRIPNGDAGWKRFLDELARFPDHGLNTELPMPTCSHQRKHHDVLEVIITTDLRLTRQPGLNHPCGRQRCVVLQTSAFQPQPLPQVVKLCPAHHWVLIDSLDDVAGQFRRKWRRLCHEH